MDFLNQLLDAYMANVDLYFPVLFSVFILGMATAFALTTQDEQLRMVIVGGAGLILLALVLGLHTQQAITPEMTTTLTLEAGADDVAASCRLRSWAWFVIP